MKKPKSKSKLKQSLKSNIDKIKTKIKPQLTWFSQLLSTENKAKLKTVWLKVDARYAATPKVDKIVIGSAAVLAMGSVAWAAVGTGTGNQEANVAGAQVQIYDRGGQLASSLLGKLGYGQGGGKYPLPRRQQRSIVAGSSTDCSSWANYVDSETKALITKSTGKQISSFPPQVATPDIVRALAGKNAVTFTKTPSGGRSGQLTDATLKPGMVILSGRVGENHAVNYAGTVCRVNHVGIVVRINGQLKIADVRGDNQAKGIGDGQKNPRGGGVNLFPSVAAFLGNRLTNTRHYVIAGDPLKEVRALIGDTATATLNGNDIATNESPGQGEIGGKPGIFGQPIEGEDGTIEDGDYLGDADMQGTGISSVLYQLVMSRVASSAWHRGVSLASEPRLLAELAYMRTIQNLLNNARSASIERRESLSAAYLGTVKEPVLENKNKEQYNTVTKNGAE